MDAMVVAKWGDKISPRRMPIPEPGPGEVLVRVKACGVGLTVLNTINGDLSQRNPDFLPRIPGHEIAGTVEALGPGVSGLKQGDRVLAYFYITCGHCQFCRQGREPLCDNLQGLIGSHRDGGYAEYVVLPERNLFTFPDTISYTDATVIPDAIATPVHVIQTRLQVRPGDTTVVIGAAGGVGVHAVQMAKLFGSSVIAIDVDDDKLAFVRDEIHSDLVFNANDVTAQDIMDATEGRGATVVVDTVGKPETHELSLQVLGKGGRLGVLTTFPDVSFPVKPVDMVFRELTVIGSRYTSHHELMQAIDLVAKGGIRPIVSAIDKLANVESLHEKLRRNALLGRAAITFD